MSIEAEAEGEFCLLLRVRSFGRPEQFEQTAQRIARDLLVKKYDSDVYMVDEEIANKLISQSKEITDPRENT
jgi:hypothetical protein